jgi:hypothetical protein
MGFLDDERVVAVKKLKDMIKGEEEFSGEISIMGIYNIPHELSQIAWFLFRRIP